MSAPVTLPGQKAECGKCGYEITFMPHGEWQHTDSKAKTLNHQIRTAHYDVDDPIKPAESAAFLKRLETAAKARSLPGRSKVKKEKPAPPAEEPYSPADYGVRTTANCKTCHNPIIVVKHHETGERVWNHVGGPVHEGVFKEAHTTLRTAKKTDEEIEALKYEPVGKPKGDPVTGEVTIPERKPRTRWDFVNAEVEEVRPGREGEILQSDPNYIDAEGNITSREAATLSKASRVERGVILKGQQHLEKDHPWIAEDSLHPDKQNIDTVVHPVTGAIIRKNLEAAPRGDIFSTTGAAKGAGPTEIPVRKTNWKSSGGRATVDIQVKKRLQGYVDRARWHKETFDPQDRYEYNVYSETPEIGEPKIGVRRRVKYCNKCAPVLLQDGSIPHAQTDPSLPRIQNAGQSFVRPEPKELPEGSAPWVRTLPSGKVSVGRHPDNVGTKLIRADVSQMKEEIAQTGSAKLDGFNLGSGEGKQ